MQKGPELTVVESSASAWEAYGQKRYKDALPLLTSLADQGDVDALIAVGWINKTGAGGVRDLEFAKLCYRRAADLGSLDALYRLGVVLSRSNDVREALLVFERGAEQGHLPCISALGMEMIRAARSPEETKIGMKWLNDAADRGHLRARAKVVALRMEEEINRGEDASLLKLLKLAPKLISIKVEYYIERKSNKFSDKIL